MTFGGELGDVITSVGTGDLRRAIGEPGVCAGRAGRIDVPPGARLPPIGAPSGGGAIEAGLSAVAVPAAAASAAASVTSPGVPARGGCLFSLLDRELLCLIAECLVTGEAHTVVAPPAS